MGVREAKIEKYLSDQVKIHFPDGMCEKWGLSSNPDQILFLRSKSYFLEIKTIKGKEQSNQTRQIVRIKATGNIVFTLKGHVGVDWFIEYLKKNVNSTAS